LALWTLPSCFRPEVVSKYFKVFPSYTKEQILEMQYNVLMYRGLQPNPDMFSADFFYFYGKLQKDSRDKKLDPYPYKMQGTLT